MKNLGDLFLGGMYDEKNERLIVFTNHNGSKPVFYIKHRDDFYAGSEVNYILKACRQNNIPLTLNEKAIYQMLSFGFIIDESTYAKEILRLQAGQYAVFEKGKLFIKTYHKYKKDCQRFQGC